MSETAHDEFNLEDALATIESSPSAVDLASLSSAHLLDGNIQAGLGAAFSTGDQYGQVVRELFGSMSPALDHESDSVDFPDSLFTTAVIDKPRYVASATYDEVWGPSDKPEAEIRTATPVKGEEPCFKVAPPRHALPRVGPGDELSSGYSSAPSPTSDAAPISAEGSLLKRGERPSPSSSTKMTPNPIRIKPLGEINEEALTYSPTDAGGTVTGAIEPLVTALELHQMTGLYSMLCASMYSNELKNVRNLDPVTFVHIAATVRSLAALLDRLRPGSGVAGGAVPEP